MNWGPASLQSGCEETGGDRCQSALKTHLHEQGGTERVPVSGPGFLKLFFLQTLKYMILSKYKPEQ